MNAQSRGSGHVEVDHIAKERWGRHLVDADWHAFCQACNKGIEGEDRRDLYEAYKERSRSVEVKKPQEALKAKALWKMKSAKDEGEECYDPTRENNILVRNETRLTLGKSTSKIRSWHWIKL